MWFFLIILQQLILPTLTASLPPAPLDLISNHGSSFTPPFNATISELTNRHLPADPTIFHIPSTTDYLRFSHYGRSIDKDGFVLTALAASRDLGRRTSMLDARIARSLDYHAAEYDVGLHLMPSGLTWGQWAAALDTMGDFYQIWDAVTLMFEIYDEKHRRVGGGYVWFGHV